MKYVLLVLALFSTSALAEVSGSVSLGSNYIFRGQDQNASNPAASADLSVSKNGFYAGVWASQVDYGSDVEVEYDLYFGKEFDIKSVSVNVSYIDYNYSSFSNLTDFEESSLDVEEVALSLRYKDAYVSYFKNLDNDSDYMEVGVALFDIVDLSVGDFSGLGYHWQGSRTVDVNDVLVTFGYRSFTGDAGVADEKSAIVSLTKTF